MNEEPETHLSVTVLFCTATKIGYRRGRFDEVGMRAKGKTAKIRQSATI
jgi:hypothetical protein